jgi:hypothetical protein
MSDQDMTPLEVGDWPKWAEGLTALGVLDLSPEAVRADRSHLGVQPLVGGRGRLSRCGPTGFDWEHW